MRGRFVVVAAVCAVLVTGCASTVSGAGVRGSGGDGHTSSTPAQPRGASSGSASASSASTVGDESAASSSTVPSSPVASSPASSTTATPGPRSSTAPPSTMSGSSTIRPIPPAHTSTSSTSRTPAPARTTREGGSPSAQQGGTSTPAAEFDGATPADPDDFPGLVTDVGFQSPSGNIRCGLQDGIAVCQIGSFNYTPPQHDCGASGWGFNFKLKPAGSAFLFCAGDVESGGPTLAYGTEITVGHVRCVSRQDGVTCQNTASAYGFRVARASYVLFGPDGASATTVGSAGPTSPSAGIPAALVGTWSGHGRQLTITGSGAGTLTYRTYQYCDQHPKPCDRVKGNEIISGGHVDFTLTAASGAHAASGTISRSTDPKSSAGTPMTATVTGYDLRLSIWPDTPFCAANTPSGQWNCGA